MPCRPAGVLLAALLLGLAGALWLQRPAPGRLAELLGGEVALESESEFCNGSSKGAGHGRTAGGFKLPQAWERVCRKLVPSGSVHWPGENWCWKAMKHDGCFTEQGRLTWRDAQAKIAEEGLAPFPDTAPMLALEQPELCDQRGFGAPLRVDSWEAEAATRWLRRTVAVYVLTLPTDGDRWASMSSNLKGLEIDFQWVDGIDVTTLNKYKEAQWQGLVPRNYSLQAAEARAQTLGVRPGIVGTIGSAASHLRAMRVASQPAFGDDRPLALILEDDSTLSDDFAPKLRRLLEEEAPCDWSVISLRSMCPIGECVSRHLTRVWPDYDEPAEKCHHGVNFGLQGMLYRRGDLARLRSRLSDTVWNEERPHCLQVDVALAAISDEVAYYAVPSVQDPGFLATGRSESQRGTVDPASVQSEAPERERVACDAYALETGCSWTAAWSCPGQHPEGTEGAARDDHSLGYRCCCAYGGWKEAAQAQAPATTQ